ncbi:MAG: glycosyltransferase [Candidatus Thermoplasmatota archaeon]|nr:glycosyltransferase [Candidatus Thermoplasmatota archaeon]
MPKVTVIIPTMNCASDLESCLGALREQTFKDFDVLIVDGHSKDDTVKAAEKNGAKVIFDEGRNRGHACNTALENVTAPYIAFTDADCIPRPDWLEKLMAQLEAKPEIACAGGPNYSPPDDPEFAKCVDVVYSSKVMTGNARYGKQFKEIVPIDHNPGCNAAYRTDVSKKAGFDADLPTAEDVVFDYKIRKNGGKLIFVPDSLVWHRRRPTMKGYWKQVYRYGLGRAMANKKYHELKSWYHLGPTALIFAAGAWIVFSAVSLSIIGWRFPFAIAGAAAIGYLAGCIYGASVSYSQYKTFGRVLKASLLIPVGHLAWGLGYIKGCK